MATEAPACAAGDATDASVVLDVVLLQPRGPSACPQPSTRETRPKITNQHNRSEPRWRPTQI